LKRFSVDEQGGTSVEYSIIAVIVSIGIVAGLAIIGPTVMGMYADAAAGF
jgi:Flp pilus assembly pilin Flp